MSAIENYSKPKEWAIEAVEVDSEKTRLADYRTVVMSDEEIRIEPANVVLEVVEANDGRLKLEGNSTRFYADVRESDGRLNLTLSRPDFSSSVGIFATS